MPKIRVFILNMIENLIILYHFIKLDHASWCWSRCRAQLYFGHNWWEKYNARLWNAHGICWWKTFSRFYIYWWGANCQFMPLIYKQVQHQVIWARILIVSSFHIFILIIVERCLIWPKWLGIQVFGIIINNIKVWNITTGPLYMTYPSKAIVPVLLVKNALFLIASK